MSLLKSWYRLIERHEEYVVLACIVLLLRVPSFFEPYWYGDEAIYLTIGNAIRSGLMLYRDIVDHKTPLIYFFAATGSQTLFKFLFAAWMTVCSMAFLWILNKLKFVRSIAWTFTAIFVLLTTLPLLEGHIANGELFVMGFVLLGIWVLLQTHLAKGALLERFRETEPSSYNLDYFKMFLVGLLFGGAVLTKVPAVFDLAFPGGVIIVGLVSALLKKTWNVAWRYVVSGALILFGVILTVSLSAALFWLAGSLQPYIEFGWTYNFRYTQAFQVESTWPMVTWLFSGTGKLVLLGISGLMLLLPHSIVSKKLKPFLFWLGAAMYAALLSNRAYPHYFLQIIPPFLFVIAWWVRRKHLPEISVSAVLMAYLVLAVITLQLRPYPVFGYYVNFGQYITGFKTEQQYRSWFNPLMTDTYAFAENIRETTNPSDRIFIWGTNPMLYALSNRNPAGRFTVSFHIKDFNAKDESLAAVREHKVPVIVMMHDESDPFPELQLELQQQYVLTNISPTMSMYRRISSTAFK